MPPLPPVAIISVSRGGSGSLFPTVLLAPHPASRSAAAAKASARRISSDRGGGAQLCVERVGVGDCGHPLGESARTDSKPGCSAWAMILPISWNSSAWTPRVASAERRRAGRGDHRRTRVERHCVAVDGDADVVQAVLGLLAVELGLAQVDEHEVHVGAAREQFTPLPAPQLLGHRLGARHGALLALLEDVGLGDLERDRLAGDDVLERAALLAREHGGVDLLGELLAARIKPARGPPSVLCIVDVTTSAYGTGLGCRPAATRPAKWAMSTIS